MSRPTTKAGLMIATTENYRKLSTFISGLTEKKLSTDFDFSADEKRKEAHWAPILSVIHPATMIGPK